MFTEDYDYAETNDKKIEEMRKLLYSAISDGLTPMQKFCITEHYLKGRPMKSIAAELNVNPSTITRHIQRGENRLRRITKYYH